MPAQENATTEDRIPIFDRSMQASFIHMKDGEIRVDYKGWERTCYTFAATMRTMKYYGRDYRRMSRSEVSSFDAMPKVQVRRHRLYFDGREIKTNAWRVYEVRAAYYWNGGVLLGASTSRGVWSLGGYLRFIGPSENELGFIDLGAGTCKFNVIDWSHYRPKLSFITPVTIDASRGDLKLDVGVPDRVYSHEVFDLAVSVTNNSSEPVQVPLPLADGLSVALGAEEKPLGGMSMLYSENIFLRSSPDPAPVTLAPGESVAAAVPTRPSALTYGYTSPGPKRTRLLFQWDALLDPGDRERMTRLATREMWLDTLESPQVDTSSRDLLLEVSAPASLSFDLTSLTNAWLGGRRGLDNGKVYDGGTFEVKVAVTNVSGRTILVPHDLGDGLGVVYMCPAAYRMRDGTVISSFHTRDEERLRAASVEVIRKPYMVRRPAVRFPYVASCSPLAPGATRETMVAFDPLRLFHPFTGDSRYSMTFVWDCLLDPDDREHVSRFSTGKTVWVDVTK